MLLHLLSNGKADMPFNNREVTNFLNWKLFYLSFCKATDPNGQVSRTQHTSRHCTSTRSTWAIVQLYSLTLPKTGIFIFPPDFNKLTAAYIFLTDIHCILRLKRAEMPSHSRACFTESPIKCPTFLLKPCWMGRLTPPRSRRGLKWGCSSSAKPVE